MGDEPGEVANYLAAGKYGGDNRFCTFKIRQKIDPGAGVEKIGTIKFALLFPGHIVHINTFKRNHFALLLNSGRSHLPNLKNTQSLIINGIDVNNNARKK